MKALCQTQLTLNAQRFLPAQSLEREGHTHQLRQQPAHRPARILVEQQRAQPNEIREATVYLLKAEIRLRREMRAGLTEPLKARGLGTLGGFTAGGFLAASRVRAIMADRDEYGRSFLPAAAPAGTSR